MGLVRALFTLVRRIAKGNRVVIPIMGMNQSRLLWGDDALEFRYDEVVAARSRR